MDREQQFRQRARQLNGLPSATLHSILGEKIGKLSSESSYWDYREVEVIEKTLNIRRYAMGDLDA